MDTESLQGVLPSADELDPLKSEYLYCTVVFHPPPSADPNEFVGSFLRDMRDEFGNHEVDSNLIAAVGAGVDDEHSQQDVGMVVATGRCKEGLKATLRLPKTPEGMRMRQNVLDGKYGGVSVEMDKGTAIHGKLGERKLSVVNKRIKRISLVGEPAMANARIMRTSVFASKEGPKSNETESENGSQGGHSFTDLWLILKENKGSTSEENQTMADNKNESVGPGKAVVDQKTLDDMQAKLAKFEEMSKVVSDLDALKKQIEEGKKALEESQKETGNLLKRKSALLEETVVRPYSEVAKGLREELPNMKKEEAEVLKAFLDNLDNSSKDPVALEQASKLFEVVRALNTAAVSRGKKSWDESQAETMKTHAELKKQNEEYKQLVEKMKMTNARATSLNDPKFQELMRQAEAVGGTPDRKPEEQKKDGEAKQEEAKGSRVTPAGGESEKPFDPTQGMSVEQAEIYKKMQQGTMFASKVMKTTQVTEENTPLSKGSTILPGGNTDPDAQRRTDEFLAAFLSFNK